MLAYSVIEPKSKAPERYMLFLHGILGTRANWRGIARRFVEARHDWGGILVDLREHGDSLGEPPPHTVASAAADVSRLGESLGLPIAGALGHSFGGKVVLEWLRSRAGEPTESWVIDSSPSRTQLERDDTATAEILRILSKLPRRWASREAFISALSSAGQPEPIAQWLAMNLKRSDDGTRIFGPALGVIRELLEDYAGLDLWQVVDPPPPACTLDFVVGGRSSVLSPADLARLDRIAEAEPRLRVHIIEPAGHWVHVDSTDALVALLTEGFASPPADGS